MLKVNDKFKRRSVRTRFKLKMVNNGRMRLSVFRSEKHIYVQLIDDRVGCTLASASSCEKDFGGLGANVAAAQRVGKIIAERAISKGISEVFFDRGGYKYHGRVKAVADAARMAGLVF